MLRRKRGRGDGGVGVQGGPQRALTWSRDLKAMRKRLSVIVGREYIPSGENGKHKGPEAGAYLACLKQSEEGRRQVYRKTRGEETRPHVWAVVKI